MTALDASHDDDLLAQVGGDQGSQIHPRGGALAVPEPPPPPVVLTEGGVRGPFSNTIWDGYALGDLLGVGGMGAVYRAAQLATGRVVAFKVLNDAGHEDPHQRARFANEVLAAARIDSPQVVRVYDSGTHHGRMWLAMECIHGRTLAEEQRIRAVAGRRFTPAEVVDLALQAARGLAAAHALRLVHRDIKPGNLLLTDDGTLKIVDFGLVRLLDGLTMTRTGTVLGTPLYLPPEQGRGLTTDTSGDIYSLGVVLYELLTMRAPFLGETSDALIFQHNYAEPPLPSELNPAVSQDLQAVCLKCLMKDPTRRFADGTALVADLERVRAGLAPTSAVFPGGRPLTGADEALHRLAGWRRRWWPIAASMLVMSVAIAGWWWLDARRDEADDLRGRLAPLTLVGPISATAAADIDRLASLAGDEDPLVVQGRSRLVRVAELTAGLAALERTPDPDRAAVAKMDAGVTALSELVGIDGDPRLARWRGWAASLAPRIERLRERLAPRLRGQDLYSAALRAEVAEELEVFFRLAADNDPDRRAWQALVQRTHALIAEDQHTLERLDVPTPLRALEMEPLRQALDRLDRLAPDTAARIAWRRRLGTEEAELAAAKAVLEWLAGPEQALRAGTRADLVVALDYLGARDALTIDEERRWRTRLAANAIEMAALQARLAFLDAPRSLPAGTGELLARYEDLAGFQDPQVVAWRRRYEEIRTLQNRLSQLDAPATPTEQAPADLERLAALVGADDPQVAAWRHKLTTIAALREQLAPVFASPGDLPAAVDTVLANLMPLVGENDPDLRRWIARRDEQRHLAATLDAWEQQAILPVEQVAAARHALARYHALAGADARSARAARRLAALLGPQRPGWASAAGHDRYGPWIELNLHGAQQRLRWLPSLTFTLGSPPDEPGRKGDEAAVQIHLRHGRWVADRECTQALWATVMGTTPARRQDPRLPVESISANEAEAFCVRLATLLPGCAARLPTEAEWEAAMRVGSSGPWGAIDPAQIEVAVVHLVPGISGPRLPGSGVANPIGLYDGPGNVWEWCAGAYGPPPVGILVEDPSPLPGNQRVARGGSWGDPLSACRLANRLALDGVVRSAYLGFRFVVDPLDAEVAP